MLNNGSNKGCGFEDLMVSYIYDETTTAERREFEGHLLDCAVCTDEFASISNARFSVFEWQKESFADLSTPNIVIPYKAKPRSTENAGFLAALQGLLGSFGLQAAAAAAILFVLGLGLVAFTLFVDRDEQIAANLKVEMPMVEKTATTKAPVVGTPVVPSEVVSQNETPARLSEPRATKTVSESRRSKPARQLTAETAERVRPLPAKTKAPVLSNFDENDDKSLRLTDLFGDEIGSRF